MTVYCLDPDFGVTVDYWADSMQIFINCDGHDSHRMNRGYRASGMGGTNSSSHIIREEDLVFDKAEGKA